MSHLIFFILKQTEEGAAVYFKVVKQILDIREATSFTSNQIQSSEYKFKIQIIKAAQFKNHPGDFFLWSPFA